MVFVEDNAEISKKYKVIFFGTANTWVFVRACLLEK